MKHNILTKSLNSLMVFTNKLFVPIKFLVYKIRNFLNGSERELPIVIIFYSIVFFFCTNESLFCEMNSSVFSNFSRLKNKNAYD